MDGAIRTLEDFHLTGRAINAHCSHYWVCSHEARLRLDVLAVRLGWSFDFYHGRDYLARRLRCSICGWHNPTFALGHANPPTGFAGSHGAGSDPLPVERLAELVRQREANRAGDMPWVGVRKGGRKFGR